MLSRSRILCTRRFPIRTPIRAQSSGAPAIFDREMKRRQRDWAASSNVTESRITDYLRAEVADRVVDRLLDIKREHWPRVLDLGAGSGQLARLLSPDAVDEVIMLDSSGTTRPD